MTPPAADVDLHAGYIGFVGVANAGKSTLFNKLMEMPLAPVSHKAQTTRRRLSGVYNFSHGQAILFDLPGYIAGAQKSSKLASEIEQATLEGANDADVLCLVLDARQELLPQLEKFQEQKYQKDFVVILNIPARLPDHKLSAAWKFVAETPFFKDQALLFFDEKWVAFQKKFQEAIYKILPTVKKNLVDPDLYTLENLKELTRERILEKCFLNLKEEIPYEMDAHIIQYREEKGLHKIYVDLLVSQEKYKAIVIGSKGSMLRKIGESTRHELEKIFDSKIFLSLNVKVKEGWHKNPAVLKELGYSTAALKKSLKARAAPKGKSKV